MPFELKPAISHNRQFGTCSSVFVKRSSRLMERRPRLFRQTGFREAVGAGGYTGDNFHRNPAKISGPVSLR
jgi:hypothetical protein